MKVIRCCNMNIGISLIDQDNFTNLDKYYVDLPYQYQIISKEYEELEIPNGNPIVETEYSITYMVDGKRIQIQKESMYEGAIVYDGDIVYLYPKKKSYYVEYVFSQYAFVYFLEKNHGILMHGSSFIYNNKGIILTAKSGTGKSTHARLWKKYEDIVVINDDKNALLLLEDGVHMYGSPWSGKHHIDNNIDHRMDAVCFLYQNKTNEIRRLKPKEALLKLFGQIVAPSKENQEIWNTITDKLLELPIYYLGCNMEKEAYLTLKERLDMDLCQ